MNELPSDLTQDPNVVTGSADSIAENAPHRRIFAHMRRLLKSAAAGAVLSTSGCIVCDPVPPPPECSTVLAEGSIAMYMNTYASWRLSDGVPVVFVEMYTSWSENNLWFSGSPTVQGGTLGCLLTTDWKITFHVMPDDDVSSIPITVPLSCEDSSLVYKVSLDVSGSREPGSYVPVQVENP